MTGRPSGSQMEALVEFLERNPGIAKGLLRTTQGKLDVKTKWASVAIELNGLGGAIKDGQGWAKYWAEKKCALKKLSAQISASARRTGGGPAENLSTLSALEKRLLAIMGGHSFATGDNTLAVNPFPNSEIIPVNEMPVADPEENIEIFIPTSPVQNTTNIQDSQTVTSPVSHSAATSSRRRRHSTQRVDGDINLFARIEERRVAAETTTSQALAVAADALNTNALAMQGIQSELASMANALTSIANALTLIANAISNNSQSNQSMN